MTSDGSEPSGLAACRDRLLFWDVPRFTLFLSLAVGVCFWKVILGAETFVYRDYGLFGYPLAFYNREIFWQGGIPLWNPLSNAGLPYLAQWNTMTLYPLALIYLILPLTWALPLFCLGHLVAGGVGMFALTRAWTRDSVAAAVAGTAYAFSGLMFNSLMWPNNIAALGLLPWVVWTLERAALVGGRNLFLAALVGGLQMLAGAPEVILFTWLIGGFLAIIALAKQPSGAVLRGFARIALVVGLTAALAMAQLLPFLQLLKESHRSAGVVGYESAMPGWGWANFLAPLFHTYKSNSGVHFQAGQVWTSSYYISIIALAFAILGGARRLPRTWALLAITLVSMVLALGHNGYLYTWVREAFPQIAIMNFPIKFVIPILFAVPALAAFGFASMNPGVKKIGLVSVSGALLALLAGIAAWSWASPMEQSEWPAVGWNSLCRGLFLAGAVYLVAQGPAFLPRFWLSAALLALLAADVATHAPWQNPTAGPAAYERNLNPVRKLDPVPLHGHSRAMLTGQALNAFRFAMQPDPFRTYVGHRLGLYDNCNLLEALPKTDGFYSLYLPHEARVRGVMNSRTNLPPGLLNFLGVSHYSDPKSIINFLPREGFLPMITIGQAPVFTDATNGLRAMFQPEFDPVARVYLLPEVTNSVTARERVAASIIEWEIGAEALRVKYSAPSDTVLTVAQSIYPNWRATVDGQPTPVLRANYAFQAVAAPAGEHWIELRYVDQRFRAGCIISGAALALCLTGLFLRRKSGRDANLDSGDGQPA